MGHGMQAFLAPSVLTVYPGIGRNRPILSYMPVRGPRIFVPAPGPRAHPWTGRYVGKCENGLNGLVVIDESGAGIMVASAQLDGAAWSAARA